MRARNEANKRAAGTFEVLPSIDPKEIPHGFEYQWVSLAVHGDEKAGDAQRLFDLGWRPVPVERHIGVKTESVKEIIIGGLLLCERSKTLQERARKEEREKAQAQIGYVEIRRPGYRGQSEAARFYAEALLDGYELPEDTRGIDPDRILPIVSHLSTNATYTWTDKLTWGLWLCGWRYVPADRHEEYRTATKDPDRKRVLFFDREQPRYLIERQGPYEYVRPRFDLVNRLLGWLPFKK